MLTTMPDSALLTDVTYENKKNISYKGTSKNVFLLEENYEKNILKNILAQRRMNRNPARLKISKFFLI